MAGKISSLASARRKKRRKTGWSLSEIADIAAKERASYAKLGATEPDNLASGDMNKFLEEADRIDDDDDDTSAR